MRALAAVLKADCVQDRNELKKGTQMRWRNYGRLNKKTMAKLVDDIADGLRVENRMVLHQLGFMASMVDKQLSVIEDELLSRETGEDKAPRMESINRFLDEAYGKAIQACELIEKVASEYLSAA
jgi:hypothetical protein